MGNVEDIKDYHKQIFLPKLEAHLDSPTDLAAALRATELKLKLKYGKYCVNIPVSQSVACEEKDFFTKLHEKHKMRKTMDDLLIAPVQRIMRYQLLLRSLTKESEDYADCQVVFFFWH